MTNIKDAMMKYCAGIVTYNPDLALLNDCIISIVSQVDCLIVVDNGSRNENEIVQILNALPYKFFFLPLHSNRGVAYALNCIGEYAIMQGCEWFITLDQDSVCPPDMLQKYVLYENIEEVGMICPYIQQRIHENKRLLFLTKYKYIQIAITSGSMLKVAAWKDVNGFWNNLFIDRVDDDICLALRDKGWKILQTFEVVLNHEIGHPRRHSFLSKHYYTDSYPNFRYYYIGRNTVVVCKYYKNLPYKMSKLLLRRFAKLVFGEKNKFPKIRFFINGIIDGYRWYKRGLIRE